MLNQTDSNILQQYIATLQRENEAKTKEQYVLYRQLQDLQKQYSVMEKYYQENRFIKKDIRRLEESLQRFKERESAYEYRLQQNQQIYDENAKLQNQKNELELKISVLQQNLQSKNIRLREIQCQNGVLKQKLHQKQGQNGKLSELYQGQCDQNILLREKVDEFTKEMNMQNMQDLVQNYQKIQQIVLQKEQTIRELQQYISDLQQQCQSYAQQNRQAQMQIKSLQAQVLQLQIAQNIGEDSLWQMTEGIPKIELIRQNNRMLQRITQLQKQNRNSNDQRYAYSECGDAKRDSPSKLQLRIQTLKMENQNLMRNLAL